MRTKDVTIEVDGKKVVVTMRRLNYGELNRLGEESTDIKMNGNVPIVRVNQSALKENSILKSVAGAIDELNQTRVITLAVVQSLDADDGNKLYETFLELNSPDLKKND